MRLWLPDLQCVMLEQFWDLGAASFVCQIAGLGGGWIGVWAWVVAAPCLLHASVLETPQPYFRTGLGVP